MKNRNQKIIHYENESNQTFLSSNLYYCIAADAGMHKPAFAALMKHVKEADNQYRTVIMVQVQNEVGILGSPRDHSPKAEEAFYSAVPQELINYLSANKEKLLPETSELWATSE